MHSERLVVYTKGEKGLNPAYELDVLPRMRVQDIVQLVSGVAAPGDVVKYEDGFYLVKGQAIRPMMRSEVRELGLVEEDNDR